MSRTTMLILTSLAVIGCGMVIDAAEAPRNEPVGPVPERVRTELKLDAFYQKYSDLSGFAIVGSAKVSDYALLRGGMDPAAHDGRSSRIILRAMAAKGVRLTVMAYNEYTTDVPEHRDMKPRVFWDRRARGLGGSPVSCAEENLLAIPAIPTRRRTS